MKRSYELLIAEKLQQHGLMTNIQDGISHMSKGNGKGYSAAVFEAEDEKYWIITVIFSESMIVVYELQESDESILEIVKAGFLD